MNKNTHIAITIEENGKYYAFVVKWHNSYNLKCLFKRYTGILHANICDTKKEATSCVECWNENYKKNGTYLFQDLLKGDI